MNSSTQHIFTIDLVEKFQGFNYLVKRDQSHTHTTNTRYFDIEHIETVLRPGAAPFARSESRSLHELSDKLVFVVSANPSVNFNHIAPY